MFFLKLFTKYFFIFFLLSSFTFADELIIEPDAGRAPLLNAIQHAQSTIDLVMYGLTDEAFIKTLIQTKNRGKTVTILLEPNPYQAENENSRAIREFRAAHINLQWPDKKFKLIHQKTFILDDKTAIVMTFNLTHSSFTHERNFALMVSDPKEVEEIKQVFNADCAHKPVTVSESHLIWSPDDSREKIMKLIQSAHSDIKIYAQDITDYKIIGALAKAARAGISIHILLSASPEKINSRKFDFLKKAGILIQNDRHFYIHAKIIIIDHQRAILGSINLTAPSLDDNRELSIITEDRNVINALNNTFDYDWEKYQ